MVLLGIFLVIVAWIKSDYFSLHFLPICILAPFFVMKDMKRLNALGYDDCFLYFGKPEADQKTP
jgi:hypothetical protein